MTVGRQWAVVAAVVVLLAGGLFTVTQLLRDELFPVTIGSAAPPFAAITIDERGTTKTLADYDGDVVLLNIWATWCLPCREEMPSLQALHTSYAGAGLKVVAVSVDDPGAGQAIRDFAHEYRLTFEILHDQAGAIRRDYQTTGVPETVVIGRDGVIRRKQIGHANWNSAGNRALVAQLLGVPADSAAASPTQPGLDVPRSTPVPAAPAAVGARGPVR